MIANDQEVLSIGDIVEIYDKISDDELLTTATVKYIEVEVTDSFEYKWVYFVSTNELLNTNFDPRFGYFYTVLEINERNIKKISNFTTN